MSIVCAVCSIFIGIKSNLGDVYIAIICIFELVGYTFYAASLSSLSFVYIIETLPERGFVIVTGFYWITYYIISTVASGILNEYLLSGGKLETIYIAYLLCGSVVAILVCNSKNLGRFICDFCYPGNKEKN